MQESCNNGSVLVSVVVPTYKQTDLLHKAIESIQAQTYHNLEIIVVDDNVEESYRNANREYFNSLCDDRIVYIQNAVNSGAAKSRNRAIECARGSYITFLDDDDIYASEKVEKQLKYTKENDLDVSVCNMILTDDNGKVVDRRQRRYFSNNESLLCMHLKYHITGTDTMMFKADFLKKIGGFDEQDFGDEFFLMLKAIEHTDKIGHLDYDGAYATVHSLTGISSYANKKKIENEVMTVKTKYFSQLSKKDIRFIKMRHYVVLAVASKKGKKFFECFVNLIKAFFLSPKGLLRLYSGDCR